SGTGQASHPILPLACLQSAVFLVNSRSHLFSEAFRGSEREALHLRRRTFSRSYGTILQSSFIRVLSSALGFSPHPPVSVCGTVACYLKLRGFSWELGISCFVPEKGLVVTSRNCAPGFA